MTTDNSTVLDNRDYFLRIIDSVLSQSKKMGATDAEADIGAGTGLSANVRKGIIDKLEYENEKGLSITVYIDGKKGNASSSDFSDSALHNTVEAAFNIAKHASYDEHAGLVEKKLMAKNIADLDLYHPCSISPEAAIQLATECEQSAFDCDKRISNSDGTIVSTYSGINIYGNTNDFVNGWRFEKCVNWNWGYDDPF